MTSLARTLVVSFIALFAAVQIGLAGSKTVYVHSYVRKDGTVVSAHYRSAPGTASYSSATASTYSSASVPVQTSAAPAPIVSTLADPGTVHVHSYYKSNGTLVEGYDRAAPGTAATNPLTVEQSSLNAPILEASTIHVREHRQPDGLYAQEYIRSSPGAADTVVARTTSHNPVSDTTMTTSAPTHHRASTSSVVSQRDSHGRIKRSEAAKHEFERMTGYPHGRPGYVVDHIIPLKRGGCDCPENMQWQTIEDAKAKDKWE